MVLPSNSFTTFQQHHYSLACGKDYSVLAVQHVVVLFLNKNGNAKFFFLMQFFANLIHLVFIVTRNQTKNVF